MMTTALMVFLGLSATATMFILTGVAVAARRPIPAYDDEIARAGVYGLELNREGAASAAPGIAAV